ncbi:MAG: hypothetical protein AABX71_00360 [Nanoarchaeota archaeon]
MFGEKLISKLNMDKMLAGSFLLFILFSGCQTQPATHETNYRYNQQTPYIPPIPYTPPASEDYRQQQK